MKQFFDAVIVVPLEEELEVVLSHFIIVEDVSTDVQIRFSASVPDSDLSVLLVQQNSMGRTENYNAALRSVLDFDVGILICLGIAGGLSSDLNIGDVCYTGGILDLLDNAKAGENWSSGADFAFAPTFYSSPRELVVAISLDRINPATKKAHEEWLAEREEFGRSQIPGTFVGKEGEEKIQRPKLREGTIVCGAVSGSPEYNKKIRAIDRKVLAIETELGGLLSLAQFHNLPAFTVRGISDYAGAGLDKTSFEQETKNKGRLIAASNAASFLARQLSASPVVKYLHKRRSGALDKGLAAI